MRIVVDADGCPVVERTIAVAAEYGVPVLLVCDTAHEFSRAGAETLLVSQGPDSADFAIVNRLSPGDIVVTQDMGLAAMCLARRARPLRQDGMVIGDDNIDALLETRDLARRVRAAGGRTKGPPKRSPQQDRDFEAALRRLLAAGDK